MNWRSRRFPFFISLVVVSCGNLGDMCVGTPKLTAAHESVLGCAGWLDFVNDHVATVDYRDVESYESNGVQAVGTAVCARCEIQIALKNRKTLEVVATIVHEAAHLADDCSHGEYPAEAAEEQFRLDYESSGCDSLLAFP